MSAEKVCSKCQLLLSASEFYKHSRHKDGLSTVCRKCQGKLHREYYRKNKLKHNEATSLYYQSNKEKMRAYHKHYDAHVRDKKRDRLLRKERYKQLDSIVKAKLRQRQNLDREAYRRLAIERLGGRCFCCGLSSLPFLTIDHRNNDGHCDRKNGKHRMSGYSFYKHVLTVERAEEKYQAACYNCNMGRANAAYGGECPHSNSDCRFLPSSSKRQQQYQVERRIFEHLREQVFEMLGRSCFCCGEVNAAFLTVDHIYNDGHTDRKRNGRKMNPRTFFKHVLQQECATSRYRVACYNCNMGRANATSGGECPHRLGVAA